MNYLALGNRLRICRLKNDYTLQDLADLTHYSSKHIGNNERGRARPSIELLIQLSNYLNTSPDYLLQDSLLPCASYPSIYHSSELLINYQQYLEHQQWALQQFAKQYNSLFE